ncbi:hypothetical protein BH20ACI2_BH20ACI2_21120 [soil metagenome]
MTAEEITQYLTELNDELRLMDIKGEVSLFGGAVMVLAFKARPATKDVDAIFEPVREIRNASHRIAERHGLRLDWLNLAVKMFVVDHAREVLLEFSNLIVTVPDANYLLAMKMLAMRPNTEDEKDAILLIEHLGFDHREQVLAIIRGFYPKKEVKAGALLWLEEYFSK